MLLLSAILVLSMNNVRFYSYSRKLPGTDNWKPVGKADRVRTCDRQCGGAEVQQIPVNLPRQEEPEEDHEVSESGESVLIPNYDTHWLSRKISTSRIYDV
jgi:hypothetical protein